MADPHLPMSKYNEPTTPGMSLHDYFAAKAMQGIISNPSTNLNGHSSPKVLREVWKSVAHMSLDIADAMIAAKKERGT
jgi:hypothetical protein